ncbi:MAG: hypothetical protein R3D88_06685 [Alphaproteobacteria bacterium]|nr:hypothetical protein [Alphaproteobacteria bacterium]
MIIQADTPSVSKALKNLETSLTRHGAWFHDNLSIICKNGLMHMEMDGPTTVNEPIMMVPEDLLIPLEGLNVFNQNDKLCCTPDKNVLSPAQCEIGQAVVDLFNETEKLKFHRNEYPFIKYQKSPELLEMLMDGRSIHDQFKIKKSFLRKEEISMSEDEFVCWSYFQTRILGRSDPQGNVTLYILPLVDCLDHDSQGDPFFFKDKKVLYVRNKQPYVYSRQCYARYGTYDALDTFLAYGFPDKNAPFVLSIPLIIDIPGHGVLNIESQAIRPTKHEIPPQLEDLKSFVPTLTKEESSDKFTISYLFIPAISFPQSMRRILMIIMRSFIGENASQEFLVEQVYRAEDIVLKSNIEFYKDIISKTEENNAPQNLKDEIISVAETQLTKLYKYHYNPDFFSTPNG